MASSSSVVGQKAHQTLSKPTKSLPSSEVYNKKLVISIVVFIIVVIIIIVVVV